jgi:hypothetical protein
MIKLTKEQVKDVIINPSKDCNTYDQESILVYPLEIMVYGLSIQPKSMPNPLEP